MVAENAKKITVPQWSHIPAGQEIETGYPGQYLTAPRGEWVYTLYQLADKENTHVGWALEKEGEKNENI